MPELRLDDLQQLSAQSLLLFNVMRAEIFLSISVESGEIASREWHWVRIEVAALATTNNFNSLTFPIMMGGTAPPAQVLSQDTAAHRAWLVTKFELNRIVHAVIRLGTGRHD